MSDDILLSVRDLRVSFRLDKQTVAEALKGVSFDIPRNSTVALVGESGSGKSVSSLAILGLLPRETAIVDPAGRILYEGRNLVQASQAEFRRLRGRDFSMIFQEPMSSLNPVFPVGDQIAEVLRLHKGMNAKQARARGIELLDEVGIAEPARRYEAYPVQLSGGQQQRVMIAMAIACEPRLLIADEPTTALDVTIQKQIIDLIGALQKRHGLSVLWITHDLAVVGDIADRVIVMRHGVVREAGPASEVFGNPRDAYTRALIRCRPSLDRRPRRLPVIDDFLDGTGQPIAVEERRRGLAPDDETVLEVRDLCKNFVSREGLFGRRVLKAVRDVSFKLPRGKTIGLVGESGSGKSTVGLTIMRLHQADGGAVLFRGKDLLALSPAAQMEYKRHIQIIFQNPYASLNPRFVVGDILTEPMRLHRIGADDGERERMALALLDRVGLPALSLRKYPHEFSGGQRQRIAIARALTLKPEVLICDESVSALDVSVQAQVLNLLQDLQDEFRMSYLFISHDLAVVKYISDQVMVMNAGEIIEAADPDEIYRNPHQPYTQRLLASIPRGLPTQD
jgi:peptide/nickel transport system ATP-binding protein